MKRNLIPALISLAPAILLPLIQELVRPRVGHTGFIGWVLEWMPNFLIGFCVPFGILIRPRAWSERTATRLFHGWSALIIILLVAFELHNPLGPQTYDRSDIVASAAAVGLALIVFHVLVRRSITFGVDSSALANVGTSFRNERHTP
jgi:hypothetical protein